MLVQLNPEAASYAETLSTLKFAERVSGVELGPARSSKEASQVKDLMEQVFFYLVPFFFFFSFQKHQRTYLLLNYLFIILLNVNITYRDDDHVVLFVFMT